MNQDSQRISWKAFGFTIIELLVVIALIGIIASIAVPSYHDKVMRSHRTDVLASVQQILAAEENYYINNRTYAIDLTQLGFEASSLTTKHYVVSARRCQSADSKESNLTDCIEVIAAAQGEQVKDGNIIINSEGRSQREVTVNDVVTYIDF